MNIAPGELENYTPPTRRPWKTIIVVILVIASISFVVIHMSRKYKTQKADDIQILTNTVKVTVTVNPSATGTVDSVKNPAVARTGQVSGEAASAVSNLIAKAVEAEGRNDLVKARESYLEALRSAPADKTLMIESRLSEINPRIYLTLQPVQEKTDYVIQKGDSLEKIAKKYGTTKELIQKVNQLKNASQIRAGDSLKVLNGKFAIFIEKKTFTLRLFFNGQFFKRYTVTIGKNEKTPAGTFVIYDKVPEPPWFQPGRTIPYGDKENILGTRWLAIRPTGNTPPVTGYGIHGTWDDSALGKAESAGCVRMKNSDVEEVFDLVPVGTEVTITD